MRVLLSGHRGFVGRHFRAALSDHELVGIDIAEGDDCRDFFRSNDSRFDLVIHLAAVVGGRATIEGEPLSVAVDLSIDAELFGWALRARPGRIVYFSSSAAYPVALQTPTFAWRRLRETDICLDEVRQPDMTYGWAKLTGEYLAGFVRAEGVPVTVVRPFSGYGEDQALDYPFPTFIDRAKQRMDPFPIWGRGTQTRDFVHIDDVVAATLTAVREGIDGPFNVCTGRATSFLELARMVTNAAGYSPELKPMPSKPVGVMHRVGDPTVLHEFYRPKISLEDGVRRAMR